MSDRPPNPEFLGFMRLLDAIDIRHPGYLESAVRSTLDPDTVTGRAETSSSSSPVIPAEEVDAPEAGQIQAPDPARNSPAPLDSPPSPDVLEAAEILLQIKYSRPPPVPQIIVEDTSSVDTITETGAVEAVTASKRPRIRVIAPRQHEEQVQEAEQKEQEPLQQESTTETLVYTESPTTGAIEVTKTIQKTRTRAPRKKKQQAAQEEEGEGKEREKATEVLVYSESPSTGAVEVTSTTKKPRSRAPRKPKQQLAAGQEPQQKKNKRKTKTALMYTEAPTSDSSPAPITPVIGAFTQLPPATATSPAPETAVQLEDDAEDKEKWMYQCFGHEGCRQVFDRREHLARHIRSHTQERPFTCYREECAGKFFSRLDNLRQHLEGVHRAFPEENAAHIAKQVPSKKQVDATDEEKYGKIRKRVTESEYRAAAALYNPRSKNRKKSSTPAATTSAPQAGTNVDASPAAETPASGSGSIGQPAAPQAQQFLPILPVPEVNVNGLGISEPYFHPTPGASLKRKRQDSEISDDYIETSRPAKRPVLA